MFHYFVVCKLERIKTLITKDKIEFYKVCFDKIC